jgi:hypothetical protein
MTVPSTLPSLDFLLTCSQQTLNELELASLDRSSRSLKRAKEEISEGVAQREVAAIARFLIEHRDSIMEEARKIIDLQRRLDFQGKKTA